MNKKTRNDAIVSTVLSINNRTSKIFNKIVKDIEDGIEKQCLVSEREYSNTYDKIDKLLLSELENRLFNYKNELEGMRKFNVDLKIKYDQFETMRNMKIDGDKIEISKQYYKIIINVSW